MKIKNHMEFTDKLLEHQMEAVEVLEKYINSGSKKHALVKMPTGTGKTVVIGYVCNCFEKLKNILVVTPSKGITEQIKREIKSEIKTKLELSMQFKEVEHIYPSNKIDDLIKIKKNTVFVSTIKSLNDIRVNKKSYFEELKSKVDIIIFDEGHREPAKSWQKTVRDLDKKVILFTATPIRNDDNNFNIDKPYIYNYPFHKAVEEGRIRRVIFDAYDDKEDLENFLRYVCDKSQRFIGDKRSSKVILRFKDVIDSIKAKEILEKIGKTVIVIHETLKTNLEKNEFKNVPNPQDIKAEFWLHQNKLIEGIDYKEFSILAIYDSFADVRSLVQQVGRVVRKNSDFDESLVIYRQKGINQEKMFKEYLYYEKRLENNINLITFNFDDFFNDILLKHPPALHMNNRFLEKIDYLKKELDEELLKNFRLPLKTNIYLLKQVVNATDYKILCNHITDNIIVNEKGKIIYELNNSKEFDLVIIYSVYRNSPYLINNYFIEPKLGITVLKLKENFLFYYDSNNIICNEITDYSKKISSLYLQKLFNQESKFKQLTINNGYAVDNNIRRQVVFTEDMNNVAPSITDKYKFCTTIYGTVKGFNNDNRTRYVGFSNSRISDSSHLFTLDNYMGWLDYLSNELNSGRKQNKIFDRYAPVTTVPKKTDPINILFYIDEKQRQAISEIRGSQMYWEQIIYDIKDNQFDIIFNEKKYKMKIEFDSVNGKYILHKIDSKNLYINSREGCEDLITYLNKEQRFQILTAKYEAIYLKGNFYKIAIETFDDRLNEILIEYESMTKINNEKGKADSSTNQKADWDKDSLFYLLSSMGQNLNQTSAGSMEIYQALQEMDYLICTDLGKEIADFVGLDEQNECIYFIHCKASEATLSASKFQDICGQIIKNLDYVNPLGTREPKDIKKWNEDWIGTKYNVVRNRMIKNKENLNSQEIWDKIKQIALKQSSNIYVWALLGNMFSKDEYMKEKQKKKNQKPEIIQIDYLLMSTWSAVQNSNAQFKIYFDKK
ncbi:DEAD/DEAH box helicase [Bacillus cereus]|uniref:DEAD/DEAH box helicase n=2 Tax=Bacillus cereus group TaxID=86661 RepID=UPI0007B6B21F|nr:DEAD/DEAH box helicase family protein [Bacillus cereus]ANC11281.1 hypothetical protein WR47_29780 [Bacillus cereus]ANC16954.1 hypothetical protein WR51_28885 [Bacillus cereus]MDA1994827.1 DEAD/DEAH box helicase family protein [Bacillus cereus]MDA2000947.1 DEAD/DEAH box helicase family protein [Bacillus cereus]MDA3654132.1 DEAD/DEAH box helicase family protein [Bacillus cereus]